jgi:two-component system cell cycle response regulator
MDAPQVPNPDRITADTLCTPPRAMSAGIREACLVHIYPSGPSMGRRYPLSTTHSVLIGRGTDCAILIDDHSVSRKHARIDPTPEGYFASDLGSTNGTFVNDEPCQRCTLKDGDYLRVGNCIYRFLAGGNIEAEYHEEIYRLAIVDGLTDIPNKRYLFEFLNRELARSSRHARPLSVLVFDIDRFKSINDDHGHLCGDQVLRDMANRLKGVIRAEELFARYGGEEFVMVLPETTLHDALLVAERVRALVESEPFRFDGEALRVTVSVGVAATTGEAIDPAELLQKADEKLYEAKNAGRNRVAG